MRDLDSQAASHCHMSSIRKAQQRKDRLGGPGLPFTHKALANEST
jgi:hypothetical protein